MNNIGTFSLGEFNPKKEELSLKAQQYKDLTISGIDDKEGYELVHKARMDLVRTRTDIEKKGKELRDPHTQFNKKVSELEKELISFIEPIEKELKEKQDKIDLEKEKIKQKLEEEKKEKLQARVNQLNSINYIDYNLIGIQMMTDEEFNNLYNEKYKEFEIKEQENKIIEELKQTIFNCKSIKELEELENNNVFNNEILIIFNDRKRVLQFEEEQAEFRREQDIINQVNQCNTLDEVIKLERIWDGKALTCFSHKKNEIEKQKEIDKFKEEQEQAKQKAIKEEQEKNKKIELYKAEVFACNTQDELKRLFSETKYGDLFDYIKPFFTERKNYIIKQEQDKQTQKEFQDYLQSINYNKEDCILTPRNPQGEILIYKLIGKWKQ